jgi:hypothetical protein
MHVAISRDGIRRVYPTTRGLAVQSRDNVDVSLDGTRFLMVKRVESIGTRSIVVEQNWTEELKRLVPRN